MVPKMSEEDYEEETPEFIDPEVQKQRIRQIIDYQKSICMSSTLSSSVASSHEGDALLDFMETRRFSLRRLFEMEQATLEAMVRPTPLWDNNRDDRELRTRNRQLRRTKSFVRLPGSGCCICRGFCFKL